MPEPLNYSPSRSAVYYTPTSQLRIVSLVLGCMLAAVLSCVGAYIYGWIQRDLTSLYVRGGAVVAAALAVGLLGLVPIRLGKVRNLILAAIIGALLAMIAIYVMWLAWVYHVLIGMQVQVPIDALIFHPTGLLRIIQHLNQTGTWSYRGNPSNGFPLLILWLGEAGVILAVGVLMPIKGTFTADPTCRECGSRCKHVANIPRFAADRQSEFLAAIETRNFNSLCSHPAAKHEDDPELSLRLMSCDRCKSTHVLTVNHVAWYIDSNRRAQVKFVPLIDQLLIAPEEAEQLRSVCSQIQQQREAEQAGTGKDENE